MPNVLMLATYFPKPANRLMGTWALSQAKALRRYGLDIQVISPTSWVPSILARISRGAEAYAHCPPAVDWEGLPALYPRLLWYPVGALKRRAFRSPRAQMELAWRTCERFLCRAVEQSRPSVLYAHHTAVSGYLCYQLYRRFQIPYLITDHDLDEISACATLPARRCFFEPIVEHASMMIAVCSRMEKETKRIFPAARTCTLQNGTDPLAPEMLAAPRPADIADRFVFFSCGAFYERKAFPLLVEAFAHIARKHPRALLRIAGDGVERGRVESAIRAHGLENQVELLGFIPHREVLQQLCWCDAFALIGWDEPFATVFLEAMSARKPVISADDGGINDVIQNQVHGLTVPPKDVAAASVALDRMISDTALRARLSGAAGRLFETSLKWDHNAARMAQLFEQVTARQSAQAMLA